MTKQDVDNIISVLCPNDEDFEKPIISPAYLKKELEALALEQEPCEDKRLYIQAWDKVKEDIKGIATFDNLDTVVEVMRIIDKHLQEIESEEKS